MSYAPVYFSCTISAYYHQSCEFEPCSWLGVLDATLCDKVCQRLATHQWFSPGTQVSSTNKTDCHDIAEKLLIWCLNNDHSLTVKTLQDYWEWWSEGLEFV
jgi:hypothetical protein